MGNKKILINKKQAELLGLNTVTLKEGVKNVIKITKTQYNRIFASGLITENEAEKETPKETTLVSGNNISKEITELFKYMYRENNKLSPFWEKNGLSYDEICKKLLAKGLIFSKNGIHGVSKKYDDPKEARRAIEDELRSLLPELSEKPELETEQSNAPMGSDFDSRNPAYSNEPDEPTSKVSHNDLFDVLANNSEIAILKGKSGELFVFKVDSFNLDEHEIKDFVNNNIKHLSKGEGMMSYNSSDSLSKIDDEVKQDILSVFSLDKNIVNSLNSISEGGVEDIISKFGNPEPDEYSNDSLINKIKSNIPTKSTSSFSKDETQSNIEKFRKRELGRRTSTGEIDEDSFEEPMSSERTKPSYRVGDYIAYIQGDVNIEKWYGQIVKVVDLDTEYAYRVNGYHEDKETGRVINDSPKTNELYQAVIRPSTGKMYLYLKTQYEKGLNETSLGGAGGIGTPNGVGQIGYETPFGSDTIKRGVSQTPVISEVETINNKYTHFALFKDTNKIVNGWEYPNLDLDDIIYYTKLDLRDMFPEKKLSDFRVVSRNKLIKQGINPFDISNWSNGINETMTVASAGSFQYDTPGFMGIGRNGEFKKTKPSKAQTKTQLPGGKFVSEE